ncbi:MAG TPA: fused response regulator/phosphatase [Spirochaetota bacterium]|nr:fused response regulator/phosphatase [Spirochaetota bacterium]
MNKKILLIDDEEPVRRVIGGILSRSGYEVILSGDGAEALEQLHTVTPDLIILDMHMPRMDGLAFLRKLREKKITTAPVLMVTGSTDPELKAETYKLGVYDFINKPEQTEVMLKRIENGLKIGEMIHFNEFIKVELMMAKKLQTYLYPPVTIETDNVIIHSMTKPLSDIGGDLFDYIEFRDGRLIFFIADVSGHSISAALYTAIVKMVFRWAIKQADTPAKIVEIMNREISGNIPLESFVTMFCGLIDFSRSQLSYCNGGHPPPLLFSRGAIHELEGSDPFLGPIKDAVFHDFSCGITSGDHICLFTDGVVDMKKDDRSGQQLLREIMGKDDINPEEKFALLKEAIGGDTSAKMDDDRTLMMVWVK